MKNTILRITLVAALLSVLVIRCKSPMDNITLTVSGNVIRYTRAVQVVDNSGGNTDGLTVKILGPDAGAVYNLLGRKDFKISGGILQIGLNPYMEPTDGDPVEFEIEVSGAGYVTSLFPIKIFKDQKELVQTITMLKISSPPPGVSVETPTVTLVNNAIPAPVTLSTTVENGLTEVSKVTLPAGTTFFTPAGAPLTGGQVVLTLIQADPAREGSINALFPGGSLGSDNIIGANGQVTSGVFKPSMLLKVNMTVGGSEVRTFNQPIQISSQIDQTYFNAATNADVKAGDVLPVYSYSESAGQWRFESNGTVITDAQGKLALNFSTSHLSYFMIGVPVGLCSGSIQLVVAKTNWTTATNTSYPLTAKVYTAKGTSNTPDKYVMDYALFDADTSLATVILPNMPQSKLVIVLYSGLNEVARTVVNDPCALISNALATVGINLPQPTITNPVTMNLEVKCPSVSNPTPGNDANATKVSLLPTFYMYYRLPGNGDFILLGVVQSGALSSLALTPNTRYDFKAVWGDKIKIISNYLVLQNNSTTAGPNDNLGNAAVNNLALITQACQEQGATPKP